MKAILLLTGLAMMAATRLFAGETLHLKLVPDRGTLLRNQPQEVVVKIDLSAIAEKRKTHRPPLNLAVVLDKSGSMTGAKLEKTKQAAMQLVDRLEPQDFVSLVVFSDQARVLVPAQRVDDLRALKRAIQGIEAGGSTALYSGVKLGAGEVGEYLSSRRINRVILLSDGLANIGPGSTRELRRLGCDLAEKGISVTTIGVGDDYNEDLMAGLAEASDANYYYVKDTEKLPEIFAKELGEMISVAARDVKIEIICPEGVKPLGFIGRTETFSGNCATVKLSQFTGGQSRYLLLRCLASGEQPEVARVKVSYTDEFDNGATRTTSGTVAVSVSEDRLAADKSVNHAVVAEKELMLAAVAKDAALAEADAGNYQRAAQILAVQNAALGRAYAAAPASVQTQMRDEAENLKSSESRLNDGQYDAAARKTMQSQSYNSRNSK
jgi:Ca-activated chloride channel family protein